MMISISRKLYRSCIYWCDFVYRQEVQGRGLRNSGGDKIGENDKQVIDNHFSPKQNLNNLSYCII